MEGIPLSHISAPSSLTPKRNFKTPLSCSGAEKRIPPAALTANQFKLFALLYSFSKTNSCWAEATGRSACNSMMMGDSPVRSSGREFAHCTEANSNFKGVPSNFAEKASKSGAIQISASAVEISSSPFVSASCQTTCVTIGPGTNSQKTRAPSSSRLTLKE